MWIYGVEFEARGKGNVGDVMQRLQISGFGFKLCGVEMERVFFFFLDLSALPLLKILGGKSLEVEIAASYCISIIRFISYHIISHTVSEFICYIFFNLFSCCTLQFYFNSFPSLYF